MLSAVFRIQNVPVNIAILSVIIRWNEIEILATATDDITLNFQGIQESFE